MIERLEGEKRTCEWDDPRRPLTHWSHSYIVGPPSNDAITKKVNEIIDYLNERDKDVHIKEGL